MNLDFTPDFYLQDDLDSVTLRVTGIPDLPIPAAASRPATYGEADRSGGQVLQGDKLFAWPRNISPRPPLGSQIIDGNGDVWTILDVNAPGGLKTWDCHARALSIVFGLDNQAAVFKAAYTKSPGGEAIATWTQILGGIPARFQPVDQAAQILEDAEWPKTVFHVYLGRDIFAEDIPVEPASADFRLVDSHGRHCRIVEYQRAQRIDVLPMAVCVLIIEGAEGGATDRVGQPA